MVKVSIKTVQFYKSIWFIQLFMSFRRSYTLMFIFVHIFTVALDAEFRH